MDPKVEPITPFFSSFIQVRQCERRLNEYLKVFVPHFRRLAIDDLMQVSVSVTSQFSETLVTTLLTDAMLTTETLANAILHLIALVKPRKLHESDDKVTVNRNAHPKI